MIRASLFRRAAMLAAPIGVLLLLSACGTVTKSECQVGDWRSIGLRDGRDGRSELFFAKNAESCQRFGLSADRDAWLAGRAEGLKDYCTPLSGYANGRAGREYENVCTGRAGQDFLLAYGLGGTVRDAREDARLYEEQADRAERQLREDERELLDLRAELDRASAEDRRRIRERISDLELRRFDLLTDRFGAERAAARSRAEAEDVEAEARGRFFAAFGYPPG